MRTMAFLAGRSIRIVLAVQLSVDAGHVLLANFIVARAAVDSMGDGFARPYVGGVYFRVALAAGNFVVAGMADLAHADVHGFPVARPTQFLVCVATHAIRVGHALLIEDVPDLMRLMAIGTGGQNVGLLFPELATNDLAVNGLDLRVAPGAGGGDVLAIDRGCWIGMGQYQVRGVAGGAIRSHRQALLQQGLSVDALGVVLQNIVLANLAITGDGCSFAMALAANVGNFERRYGRVRVFHRNNVVVPMTIHAVGRQRIAARNRLPVERPGMLLLLGAVAGAALYRRRRFVGKIFSFEVGVASRAAEAAVHGGGKFLAVYVERNRFTGSRRGHRLVAVAGETFSAGRVGSVGPVFGKQQKASRGEEGRDDNSQTGRPLASRNFCFNHGKLSSSFHQCLAARKASPSGAKARVLLGLRRHG